MSRICPECGCWLAADPVVEAAETKFLFACAVLAFMFLIACCCTQVWVKSTCAPETKTWDIMVSRCNAAITVLHDSCPGACLKLITGISLPSLVTLTVSVSRRPSYLHHELPVDSRLFNKSHNHGSMDTRSGLFLFLFRRRSEMSLSKTSIYWYSFTNNCPVKKRPNAALADRGRTSSYPGLNCRK